MDAATVSSILNNINSLYTNLVSYTVGLILFVGAFVPAVISFFQRKQFAKEYDDLTNKVIAELGVRFKDSELALRGEIEQAQNEEREKLNKLVQQIKAELKEEIGVVRASAFHIQAYSNESKPYLCLPSCLWALPLYIKGKDERNVRSILSIIEGTMKQLYADELGDEDFQLEDTIKKIIGILEESNVNGRYEHDINDIKVALNIAKKRNRPKETSQ